MTSDLNAPALLPLLSFLNQVCLALGYDVNCTTLEKYGQIQI
jgi:hypothetical protein